MKPKVPKQMVTLVVTAVSFFLSCTLMSTLTCNVPKVYAAVYDWQMGEKIAFDFSTDGFLDPYDSNLNTLQNMLDKHPNKYHNMMADIYVKVRCMLYSSQCQ